MHGAIVRNVLRVTVVIAAVAAAAAAAGAQTPRPAPDSITLTLAGSLARAAALSTEVLAATDSLLVSGARVLEAYGAFLPAASTGAYALSAQGNTFLSGSSLQATQAGWYSGAYQVSTALNLFNGFRDRASLKAATSLRDAAGFSLNEARQRITFDVLQAYFQIALDHQLQAVAASTLQLSQSRQARLEGQVAIGTRSPPDLFRQRAQTANDEASVIDIGARTQTDLVSLLLRLRLEATKEYAVADPPLDTVPLPADSLDRSALASRALANRPDLLAAMSRASAADAGIEQASGGYLPQVLLGASFGVLSRNYEWERQNGTSLLTQDQRAIGSQLDSQGLGVVSLGISWPLFDQFETRFAVERARATAHRSALAAEDARLRVLGDVRQATDDYHAAVEKLRATGTGLVSAQEAFDAVSARFDVGLGIFLDVQAAQNTLAEAKAQRAAASVNLVLRRQVLRYVTGTPVEAR
ncbi:MAG: TolC family protein [Gemmatimonadaceae bacterium]